MSASPNPARQPNILASFADQETLDSALSYLEGEAIPRAQLSVRHADTAGEVMTDTGQEPLREDEERNLRTLRTGTAAAVAGLATAGVVVATGGAAIPALAAAAAAGVGAGGLSEVASQATGTAPDAASDSARAILVVAPANVDQAERARGILRKVAALKVWEEPAEA
ncbi:hypothetical protein LPC08_16700 [Roseomonas sp. OT10]|uniref:hypothetical protein n=1 Tax=Roseomonas cutis TaxID=2897332 RepID=UPI001E4DA8F3|nr:hypothetical protein [Roseomonas sp. OT10]UFN47643.1 hypothetical protein LPC08_16700 [Roseomonas sp. OT10]